MKNLLFLFLLVSLSFTSSIAQITTDEIDLVKEMAQEEQEIIEAIVLYPKDIRTDIFKASTYPQVIVKLSSIQKKTSGQYKELMTKYPMDVQKSVWEMTRYPDLINQLASHPEKADQFIAKQPKEVQEKARTVFKENFPLLKEIAQLETLSFAAFERIIDPLPEEGKVVFKKLIQYPEILGLLNENLEFTILGGDLYKKYPDWTEAYADSLSLVYARQQAIELENWKTELENDPQAMKELQQATDEFASEYGYDNETIKTEKKEVIDDLYYVEEDYEYDDEEYDYDYDEVEYRTVYRDYYYHYPYWFGYPDWYAYPHWRPYPFWYEWGFYWNTHGGFHVYHMPSHFFMHWYFNHPHHHYHYAHLSHHFVNHYYGHRSYGSSIVGTVHTWRNANKDVITDKWATADKPERIRTLKEFGQMEKARTDYNKTNPKQPVTKVDYIKANKGRYPTLEKPASPKEKTKPITSKPKVDVITRPPTKTKKDRTSIYNGTKKTTKKKTNKSIEIKRARDYHNQTWKVPKTKTKPYKPNIRSKSPVVKRKTKPRKPN